ncbi:MAG: UDP-N-acetylmuramate--L-alanine ligase [Candidatus Omnitrophica bacterium]|nr:UDP-N-acetylmuramate--L-alanine ligase [Candidatus Omnitrophota bacterium]
MKNKALLKNKNIHFAGIGGIGMSGIALVLLEMGYNVSGSDVEPSAITDKLKTMGAGIFGGHAASNIKSDTQVLVYSSSISDDNPEMKEARRRNIVIAHRSEILGELFNARIGIAVTGTHGKTTTSSLISFILKKSGLDPTVVVGGEVDSLNGNAVLGKGAHMVAEADESDSSFLRLKPFYAVITNVEMEHLDHFKTLKSVRDAYGAFARNIKKGGALFYNSEDENMKKVLKSYNGRTRGFGFSAKAYAHPLNIEMKGFNTTFDCVCGGKLLGNVSLKIPGRHNVLNALAAILVGLELGLKFEEITAVMKDFEGAKRRFQMRAESNGVMLIEDYAHHPTEIRSVIAASRNWDGKRLVAVFQPHRYSRTKFFADAFGKSFAGVDKLILTDIYAASEKPIKGVSVKCLYDKAKKNGLKDIAILRKELIPDHIMKLKRPGDMIIVMGAGNIKKVADELCQRFLSEQSAGCNMVKKLRQVVKGKVKAGERLSAHTSFKIGGAVNGWIEPKDIQDLKTALSFLNKNKTPFFIIGNGSNILAKDEGFNGVLIHLGSEFFKTIKFTGARIRVGAGFSLPKLVNICCAKGLSGLESLVGIPGTIGGAIYMNAGGWTNPIFRNMGELVDSIKVMDARGKVRTLRSGDIKFGYRYSGLEGSIILEAVLKMNKADSDVLVSSASHFLKMKREKQTLDMPSAGCVFKNPPDSQFTCGQMIDTLGLKGRRCGGAEISTKHANFIVNRGGATCRDVLGLADIVKKRVKENYGLDLEMEVKII